ncbi:lipase family protein [Deinococcus pimensis]|uniref:lipase family protein n=1 Tax=Deinococcus pimensis TaxID=309888 RepID=UPI000483832F|nr:lipase family protein [Deinococcus pimensis]
MTETPRRQPHARPLTTALLTAALALVPGALARQAAPAPGAVLSGETLGTVALADVGPSVERLYKRSGMPAPKYAVRRYRLTVSSTDERGRPVTVRALLYVPDMGNRAAPLYVMGPGTTGLADACAPTREDAARDNWGNYEAHMRSYAAQGFVSVMPDWANFDDPAKVQPYFVAGSEGRVMLDTARAARAFLRGAEGTRPSDRTYLAGFSQGGHAAFAAADLAATYAPDVRVSGVIGYAPAMDVMTLFRERPALGPYLAQSYAAYYGVDASRIISPRWLPGLGREAARMCVTDVYHHYPNDARSIYRPEFEAALKAGSVAGLDPKLADLMRRNAPGFAQTGRQIPALVVTGLEDPIVTADAQLTFMRRSCAFGRPIVQRAYAGANHFTARQFGFRDTLTWMRDLEAGLAAPTSCLDAKYAMPSKRAKTPEKGTPVFVDRKR